MMLEYVKVLDAITRGARGTFLDLAGPEDGPVGSLRETVKDAGWHVQRCPDFRRTTEHGIWRRTMDVVLLYEALDTTNEKEDLLAVTHGILKRNGLLLAIGGDSEDAARLRTLLEANKFFVLQMQEVNGYVTIVATPVMTFTNVVVLGPPGTGDIIWTMNKLRDIREREAPCKLKYVVCCSNRDNLKQSDRSKDFLESSSLVDVCEFTEDPLPEDIGCVNPRIPEYHLIANYWLQPFNWEPGKEHLKCQNILDWRPELKCDFDIGVTVPEQAKIQVQQRMRGTKYAALYFSSRVWNHICLNGQGWFARNWAEVVVRISEAGLKPVILGAGWDRDYAEDVEKELRDMGHNPAKLWVNMIDRTPLLLAMAFMQQAEVTVGMAAGLCQTAAYMGWPTVMMWQEKGVLPIGQVYPFDKEFQTDWMSPEVMATGSYQPMSFGTFSVDDVMQAVSKVMDSRKELVK